MEAFQANWECKIVGTMGRDATESDKSVPSLVFLAIPIGMQPGVGLHQKEYSEGNLKQRENTHGRPSSPVVE